MCYLKCLLLTEGSKENVLQHVSVCGASANGAITKRFLNELGI